MNINPDFADVILTLANQLTERNIPHTVNVIWDGLQIRFPWNHGDIVCHGFSHGHEYGAVESYGCPWDDNDVTCVDAEDALVRIADWWYTKMGA